MASAIFTRSKATSRPSRLMIILSMLRCSSLCNIPSFYPLSTISVEFKAAITQYIVPFPLYIVTTDPVLSIESSHRTARLFGIVPKPQPPAPTFEPPNREVVENCLWIIGQLCTAFHQLLHRIDDSSEIKYMMYSSDCQRKGRKFCPCVKSHKKQLFPLPRFKGFPKIKNSGGSSPPPLFLYHLPPAFLVG